LSFISAAQWSSAILPILDEVNIPDRTDPANVNKIVDHVMEKK